VYAGQGLVGGMESDWNLSKIQMLKNEKETYTALFWSNNIMTC